MKSVWKWIIGLVVVLMIVASVVYIHTFVGRSLVALGNDYRTFRSFEYMPQMDDHYGMMTSNFSHYYPRISPIFYLFRGLIPLVFVGLLLYGAYYLGARKTGKIEKQPEQKEQAVVNEPDDTPVVEDGKTCAKCGEVVQDGWRNCPYCGKRQ